MKTKSKRNIKQAANFLKDLRQNYGPLFERVSNLLEKYEVCEADSGVIFKGIIREIQTDNDLISRLNQFLNLEHRVQFVTCEQSKEMITHIFEIMQSMTTDQSKFEEFLTLIANSSEKMDEMKITSLLEVGEFIMNEVRSYKSGDFWGDDFVSILEGSINSFINSNKTRINHPSEKVSSNHSTSDKLQNETNEIPKNIVDVHLKKSKSKPSTTPATNGSVPVTAVKPVQVITQQKETQPQIPIDEPQQFNLKIESNVFLALKSKTSEQSYNNFIKTLSLHLQNIVSYPELVKMNENIFLEIDKEICLALKEMIETRARSIHNENVFNIKYSKIESEVNGFNKSYFKIISQLFASERNEDLLINKTYLGIPRGHESAVIFDEPIANRTHKNLSEEALFRIEDEIIEL